MSGTPTESELVAQLVATVDVLDTLRNLFDGTMAGGGGKLDTLVQALEGEYTPTGLSAFANVTRAGMSDLVTPARASSALVPILFDYARLISASGGFGGAYRQPLDVARILYEWMHSNSDTVESRQITYGTPSAGGSNAGNGVLSRLTVDENGYALEACHVETKVARCRNDQNNGASEHAEAFEVVGEAASFDALLVGASGSGDSSRAVLVSKHAGSGKGGSLLNNPSFSTFTVTGGLATFPNWTIAAGASSVKVDQTVGYRGFPNSSDAAKTISLRMDGGGGTVTLRQALNANQMRTRRISPLVPHFLRAMVNATAGTAVGGNFVLRLGSQTVTVAVSTISASGGWYEVLIPIDENLWPANFLEADFAIEIEWASSTSGYLLVDDVLFCEWDLIDGTWWLLRQNAASPVSWLRDDTFTAADSGGAPGTGKIQWWFFRAGLGYLPSDASSPTISDP